MAVKINSWVKNAKKKLIPTCRANYMLNVKIEDEKYHKINTLKYSDVQLCWNYFDRNYKCYFLEPKYDGTKENYIFNLHNLQFSFRELNNSAETKEFFTIQKSAIRSIENPGFCYVSDQIGFALLHLKDEELKFITMIFNSSSLVQLKLKFQILALKMLNFGVGAFGLRHICR